MNVSLTIELEKWVQSKVESGMYTSASEVIREGLRLLKDQDALKAIRLAELRREIQQGIDSGESTPLNMDEIIELAKQQRQTRESPQWRQFL